jgi:sugar lactone lactonase YvrE
VDDVEYFDSILYFSDASSKYGYKEDKLDLFEHGRHGRLLSFDLRTGETHMLMDSLQFANGVTVSTDGSFILINETGNYSVKKYWLKGDKSGTWEYFVENLSGFPDGISRGDSDIYWLTLIQPRVEALESIMTKPWLRNQFLKLPASIAEPAPIYRGAVLGYNEYGQLIYNLQSDQPTFKQITSVEPYQDHLYLGSLEDNGIARIKIEN